MEKEKQAEWEELPDTLIDLVLLRLPLPDYIRFTAVCSSWRRAQQNHHVRSPCPPYPLLVYKNFPTDEIHTVVDRSRMSREITFPGTSHSYIMASAYGWLLCLDRHSREHLFLINPLTSSRIDFLAKLKLHVEVYSLAVISSDPCTTEAKDLIIMLMVDTILIFCRPTDQEWSVIRTSEPFSELVYQTSDMVVCNGKIYVVTSAGKFGRVSVSGSGGLSTVDWLIPEDPVKLTGINTCRFLVESLGDVLMVLAYYCDSSFKVYRADMGRKAWVAVRDLGDRVLYLGQSCSLSTPAPDARRKHGIHITFPSAYLDMKTVPKGVCWDRAKRDIAWKVPIPPSTWHWFVPSL